jgi:hypothetical protein
VVLGRISDRSGRRTALVYASALMCVGTLAIAILASYAVIGMAAPLLLLLARLVQAFSAGGEFASATAYWPSSPPIAAPSIPASAIRKNLDSMELSVVRWICRRTEYSRYRQSYPAKWEGLNGASRIYTGYKYSGMGAYRSKAKRSASNATWMGSRSEHMRLNASTDLGRGTSLIKIY